MESSNTFTVSPNAVGEEVGSFDVIIFVSAPGRNVSEEDRNLSTYTCDRSNNNLHICAHRVLWFE